MPSANEKRRTVIVVETVGKSGGQAENPVINFSARDETNAQAGYEAWGKQFVDLIVKDAKLDCEITSVENKQRPGELRNRVTQIWVDGEPVRKSSGYRSGGRSAPEQSDAQVRAKIISSEGQTAFRGIIDMLAAGVIEKDTPLVKNAMDYALAKLTAGMNVNLTVQAPAPSSSGNGSKTAPEKKPPQRDDRKDPQVDPLISKEKAEYILEIARKRGYTSITLSPLLKYYEVDRITALTTPKANSLITKIEKGEGLGEVNTLL